MNIGTNSGASCNPALQGAIEAICAASPFSFVSNGRFKGGWITRHYGRPEAGVHAVQMELACRGYMEEPTDVSEANWPPPYPASHSTRMIEVLREILYACRAWAQPASAI
jgi:formiminoglutamase